MIAGCHAILTHLGVGDGILQSGLVIALLERYDQLAFPAYPQNVETFESIFTNFADRIRVFSVPQIHGEAYGSPRDQTFETAIMAAGLHPGNQIRLGVYAGRGLNWDFSRDFYDHASVPYERKWQLCPIADAWRTVAQVESNPQNGAKRVFVHDDHSRGFVIQPSRFATDHATFILQARPELNSSILRYAQYLIDADEVHCIDSSFFWLADLLPVKGRLFLHRYARWQRPLGFRYETYRHWNYID